LLLIEKANPAPALIESRFVGANRTGTARDFMTGMARSKDESTRDAQKVYATL
jgi:hypothetical protein